MRSHFRFFEDPGHGWLAVKRAEIDALGIADQISGYSYQRGKSVYLEEDCDASVFLAALRKSGIEPTFESHHTDRRSPIRSYASYQRKQA